MCIRDSINVCNGGLDDVLDAGNHGLAQVAEAAVLGGEQLVGIFGISLQIGIQRLEQLGQGCAVQDDVNAAGQDSGLDGSDPVVPGAGLHDNLDIGILFVPCRDQFIVTGHLDAGDQVERAFSLSLIHI